MSGPVFILARASDPVVAAFRALAIEKRLDVWMPDRLDEISWSWQQSAISSVIEISDRNGKAVWNDGTLSGVWFRSLPNLTLPAGVDEIDKRYMVTEITSSFTMAWLKSRCPVVGLVPSIDSALVDAGPEVRTELRRLGVTTMADRIGLFGDIVATSDDDKQELWITTSRRSGWLSDLLVSRSFARRGELDGEIVIASRSSRKEMCAAIYVESDLQLLSLSDRRAVSAPPDEIVSAVNVVREATHMPVGVCYFVLDSGGWLMVRLSPHIPTWLDVRLNTWVADRLCRFFGAAAC